MLERRRDRRRTRAAAGRRRGAGQWPRRLLRGLLLLGGGLALCALAVVGGYEPSLLERALLGTWSAPAAATPPFSPQGYQESDVLYHAGQYYLFATGSQDPAWVDVYVGRTPADLVQHPPAFRRVAPVRYPTVVHDGATWHLWGVNPAQRGTTEYWISHERTPTNFDFAGAPFRGAPGGPVVDFAVRRHPRDGAWYGVGFAPGENTPLLLLRAHAPEGPWTPLDAGSPAHAGGIFGDSGAPAWARAARPDPNLAFTADGRAWVLFTGRATPPGPDPPHYRAGLVEVDVTTGQARGPAVVLVDPRAGPARPFRGASDLTLVTAPGQPERIMGYTGTAAYPLAVLELPDRLTARLWLAPRILGRALLGR